MSVDTKIYLPGNVKVRDVATVISVLAGHEAYSRSIRGSNSTYTVSDGVKIKPLEDPAIVKFLVKDPDDEEMHLAYYMFECGHLDGAIRMISATSNAYWVAMGRRLVDFFGGEIDYQDQDAIENNYAQPYKCKSENRPDSGEAWNVFQKRVLELEPITKEELDEAATLSCYGYD